MNVAHFPFFHYIFAADKNLKNDVMKRLIFCILVATAALSSWATGQRGDVIFIDGERWNLLGGPIQADSALSRHLREVLPEDRGWSSDNWKGYIAYWSIRNERLCLDSIQISIYNSETRKENCQCVPDADMRNVFHDYYNNEDIVATWYTGRIRVGRGNRVRYEHMGFDRNVEHEQIFTLKEGIVTDCVTYHNEIAVEGFSFRDLDSPRREKEFYEKMHFIDENYPELDPDKVGKDQIKVIFSVSDIQVDTLGNLVDCKVKVPRIVGLDSDEELNDRIAQDMKAVLMSIRPWKLLKIYGEYTPDSKSCSFAYIIKK